MKKEEKKQKTLAERNAYVLEELTKEGRVTNAAALAGRVKDVCKISELCGYAFNGYMAKIEAQRPSKLTDEVIVVFKKNALDSKTFKEFLPMEKYLKHGSMVLITGVQQALKNLSSGKVLVYILADYIGLSPKAMPQNEVALVGVLAFPPTYRQTPKRRRIADFLLKVPDMVNGDLCYVPCLCWDENAEWAKDLKSGDGIKLLGRYQSREYKKYLMGTGKNEIRKAYEISVSLIERIQEEKNAN